MVLLLAPCAYSCQARAQCDDVIAERPVSHSPDMGFADQPRQSSTRNYSTTRMALSTAVLGLANVRTRDLVTLTGVEYLARCPNTRNAARSRGGESIYSPIGNCSRHPAHSWCRIQAVRTTVPPTGRHAVFGNA